MHRAVKLIRDTAGKDIFIVGCGFPLGTAIGYVNAMRIGADVDKRWFPFLWWDKCVIVPPATSISRIVFLS